MPFGRVNYFTNSLSGLQKRIRKAECQLFWNLGKEEKKVLFLAGRESSAQRREYFCLKPLVIVYKFNKSSFNRFNNESNKNN